MADSTATIGLTVKIDGIDREISSLKDLKQAKKDATDAFLRGDKDAAKALADLKDKTEDLTDATQTLKGSGVEKLTSSFSQLKDGFASFDGEKISTAFKGIGSAMKAIPLLLIVEGIRYLVENFDELSKGSGLLAKALQFVGEIVAGLKDAILSFADTIQGINPELRKMSAEIDGLKESMNGLLSEQMGRLDRLIAVTKANGESTIAYENLKQEAIIKTNKLYVESIINYVKAGGQLNEEQKKLLSASLENIKNAKTQQEVLQITEDKRELDAFKKLQEEKIKAEKDAYALKLKQAEDYNKSLYEAQKSLNETVKAEKLQVEDDTNVELHQRKFTQEELDRARRNQELEEFKSNQGQQVEAVTAALKSTQVITDLFFNYKLNKHKGDAKAEREIRKKQFNVNKAFGVAMSIVDGIGAVTKALNNPYPLNIILAAAAGIAATASTIKIASAKFEPDSGGGGGGGGDAAAVPIPAPPTINTPNANTNSNTTFDENGKRIGDGEKSGQPTINVKATVGVDEITDKSNRVQVLEQQSTF